MAVTGGRKNGRNVSDGEDVIWAGFGEQQSYPSSSLGTRYFFAPNSGLQAKVSCPLEEVEDSQKKKKHETIF